MAAEQDEERRALVHFLQYQRDSVLAIVDGLDEAAWQKPVVPSGWTPAGLVQHLGDAERHWFQQVVTGSDPELPWERARLCPGRGLPLRPAGGRSRRLLPRSDRAVRRGAGGRPPVGGATRPARRPGRGRTPELALGRAAHDRGDGLPRRASRHRPGTARRPDRPRPAVEPGPRLSCWQVGQDGLDRGP